MASTPIMEVRHRGQRPCETLGFKFHCNYGNDVRIQYAQILSELAASNTLAAIASEITGHPITVAKASQELPAKILASEYAIT